MNSNQHSSTDFQRLKNERDLLLAFTELLVSFIQELAEMPCAYSVSKMRCLDSCIQCRARKLLEVIDEEAIST